MSRDEVKNSHQINFWMTPNGFVDDGHISFMGASAFTVYCVLMRYSSSSSKQCFPSYSKLQEKTGFSRATIAKAIEQLVFQGYIRKLNVGNSVNKSTIYELLDLSLVQSPDQSKNLTSSKNELVQKMSATSSKNEPQLVQKMNSINTYIKNTNFKNTHEEDFLESESFENSSPEEKKELDGEASNPEIQETPPPTPAPLRRAKISDIEKFEQKWQAENNLIDCKKLSRDSGFKKFVLARLQKLPSSKKGDWTPDFADAGNYIAAGQFDLKRRGEIELIHEAFTEYQRSQLEATQPTASSDRQPMPERSAVPTNLKNLIQK